MARGDVDLNLLRVLERVLARQSVADAAQDLGMSPSATSRALNRLRDALSDPLLVRAGNRLVPTAFAEELVEPASRAVAAVREVFGRERSFDPAEAAGELVLAMGAELQQAWLPPILHRLRRVTPHLDVRVRELTLRSVHEGRRDLLHLAVGPDLSTLPGLTEPPDLQDVVTRPLYRRHFVVLGAREHWPEAPSLDAYTSAGHVLVSTEARGHGFVDDVLADHGRTRRVVCAVTTFAAVVDVVRATDLLAVVPCEVGERAGPDLVAHTPPVALPTMDVGLFWHPRYTTQPRHRYLRGVVAQAILDGSGGEA